MSESADKNVCSECLGDASFSQWIVTNGERGQCDYDESHGDKNSVISLAALAEHVDEYFRANYGHGEEYRYATEDSDNMSYANFGEPYKYILTNALECDEDLIEELADNLPDDYWPPDGGEPFYSDDIMYESLAAAARRETDEWRYWYSEEFEQKWSAFSTTVKYKNRFFKAKQLLDELFGKSEAYQEGFVAPIYQLPIGQSLHRARVLDSTLSIQDLNSSPAQQLNAPPPDKTKAGRMNVAFIPVFYAAFSANTALAEMRPSIGDKLAVGEFRLKRPLKVFDFTVFDNIEENKALSDDELMRCYAHTRYDFLMHIQDEISKAITQNHKQLEYIPTQIIAEYLQEHFGCDAVIYKSAMCKGRDPSARNIAVLNSGVEFIGMAESPIEYVKHVFRQIDDVSYKATDEDDF